MEDSTDSSAVTEQLSRAVPCRALGVLRRAVEDSVDSSALAEQHSGGARRRAPGVLRRAMEDSSDPNAVAELLSDDALAADHQHPFAAPWRTAPTRAP